MAGTRSPVPIHYLDESIGFLVPRSFVPVVRPFVPAFRSLVPSFRSFVPYSQIHHSIQPNTVHSGYNNQVYKGRLPITSRCYSGSSLFFSYFFQLFFQIFFPQEFGKIVTIVPNTVFWSIDGNLLLKFSHKFQIKPTQPSWKCHTPLLISGLRECDRSFLISSYEGLLLLCSPSALLTIPNFRLSNPPGAALHTLATKKESMCLSGTLLHSAKGGTLDGGPQCPMSCFLIFPNVRSQN